MKQNLITIDTIKIKATKRTIWENTGRAKVDIPKNSVWQIIGSNNGIIRIKRCGVTINVNTKNTKEKRELKENFKVIATTNYQAKRPSFIKDMLEENGLGDMTILITNKFFE